MDDQAITSVLPPLYARWIDVLLESPIPPETRATCEDCAMCAPGGARPEGSSFYFSPRVKCCSYQPRLPNYLVGRALKDRELPSAGRVALERRIGGGIGVTPLGLNESPKLGVLYAHSQAAFGRAEALRCPHYLDEGGGRCGIWRHRNSVCATWFCKFERGAVGLAFWSRLRDLLLAIEESLALWCVAGSDLDPEAFEVLLLARGRGHESITAGELDEVVPPVVARQLWGKWLGREREFYAQSARRVDPLAWDDVERIGGAEVAARARLTRRAFEALLSEGRPTRLTAGPFRVLSTSHEGVRVVGYSGSDPLDLDPAVMEVLPYFDGRPTAEALRAIEKELKVRVEDDLVRKLADFEILVPPGGDSA